MCQSLDLYRLYAGEVGSGREIVGLNVRYLESTS